MTEFLLYNPTIMLLIMLLAIVVYFGGILAFVFASLHHNPSWSDITQASLLGSSGVIGVVFPPLLWAFISLALLFWFWSATQLGARHREPAKFIKEMTRLAALSLSLPALAAVYLIGSHWASV